MNHIPQTSQFTCPCCRGFIGEAAPIEFVKEAMVGPLQISIMETLASRVSRPVRQSTLIDAYWASDPDGGPDDASNAIHVAIFRMRKAIASYGWYIQGSGRGGSGHAGGGWYRLIPAEVTQ